MDRRLYFLIPDRAEALTVVDDLIRSGIDIDHMQAIGDQHTRMDGLPTAAGRHGHAAGPGQRVAWTANTVCFAIAVVATILAPAFIGLSWWLLLPIGIMAANFLTGLYLNSATSKELNLFRDALAHGEILLIVDVPETRATEVERDIQRHHPHAATSDGWSSHAMGL